MRTIIGWKLSPLVTDIPKSCRLFGFYSAYEEIPDLEDELHRISIQSESQAKVCSTYHVLRVSIGCQLSLVNWPSSIINSAYSIFRERFAYTLGVALGML